MKLSGHSMAKIPFIRLAEVINKKSEKRVVSVTVTPIITDCSGTIYFTDLQLQEGSALTGFAPYTENILAKSEDDGVVRDPVWFNAVVRSKETVIVCNLGGTSAGLDVSVYPKSDMEANSIELAQGVGGQRARFPFAVNADDEIKLLASTRECQKNGVAAKKEGFYQYSAAWDSKHIVKVEDGKTARVLFELQEMEDGGVLL